MGPLSSIAWIALGQLGARPTASMPAAHPAAGHAPSGAPLEGLPQPADPSKASATSVAPGHTATAGEDPSSGFRLFPAAPSAVRPLRPYLQLSNRAGTSALQPGALIESDPLSDAAQALKSQLASVGITYSLYQTFGIATMSDRVSGGSPLGFYSFDLNSEWTILEGDELGGTSGWVSAQFVGGTGLGFDWSEESPGGNIGAATTLNNNYYNSSIAVDELAWGQSFVDGQFVLLLGSIDTTNYLDLNRYANSSTGQLMNPSFVNSQALPAPAHNLGVVLQWQPAEWLYAMLSAGTNNRQRGASPFREVGSDDMSYLGEAGVIVEDLLGLGPGVYRVQPFLATSAGDSGGGVAFNIEQQLGATSPLGFFVRAGFGDEVTAAALSGIETEVSGGLALLSPFAAHGPFSAANNSYAAAGFVWSRASEATADLVHRDEYALELTFAFQLTATATLQPDLQLVWDPTTNPSRGPAVVFQLQLNITW